MPLDARFHAIANRVFDAGMGTEHVAPLLYHVACMRRPQNVLAVGLGYSTLFLLQALADVDRERECDERVREDVTRDVARASVLARTGEPPDAARMLVGIDDFSDSQGRLELLADCIDELGLRRYFRLQRCRYQDASLSGAPYQLAWVDCGHQIEYAALSNRFWPLVDGDGGIYAVHYTHVDIVARDPQTQLADQVIVPGPWVNAAKREIANRGLAASAELLSFVEPHKARQGSLTLLRKLEPADRCRDGDLQAECSALYGAPGEAMMLADDDAEDAE